MGGHPDVGYNYGCYNPASYHNGGAVWPHDNAIIAAGLMRYGFVHEAQRVAQAIIEAAEYTDHRLPELFCGFERSRFPKPVPYPTSCSPQAWAAAAPVQLMRTLLRYDPDVSRNEIWLDPPVLPVAWGESTCDQSTDRWWPNHYRRDRHGSDG